MKSNWKAIAGCCSTPCSLLFILWIGTVILLVAASAMHSVALRRLGSSVEELRATQTKLQDQQAKILQQSPKTQESSSNAEPR